MLNFYPVWKYFMLALTLIIGFLYAVPNLYGKDPALQITGVWGTNPSYSTQIAVHDILKKQHVVSKSITMENERIVVRFFNSDMQLRGREALISALGKNYIVALNFATATPLWLNRLGGAPMRLGLDLRGGVHFLMEVDLDTTFKKLQEQTTDIALNDLKERGIVYTVSQKIKNHSKEICFQDTETLDRAISWLRQHRYRNLFIKRINNHTLQVALPNEQLRQAREQAIQKNIAILRNRVNQLGISEPLVQRQGAEHIIVELPGIQDTARAKDILSATATLEFRFVNNLVHAITTANRRIPEDSEIKITREGFPIILHKRIILTGDHITDAIFSTDEYNRPQVNIFLDETGGRIMSDISKDNFGKLIATLLVEYKDSGKKNEKGRTLLEKKEEVINVASIQSRIGKNFRIIGIKDFNEARQLSLLLRTGSLISPVSIVEERIVGPTMGSQNIAQGLKACLYGLGLSILFMILRYRKFGFIAAMALLANLLLIIGLMSVLQDVVTLTMPGIAGIALTLAMAVDANVLINERIKEELRNGRVVQKAIHEGYRRALSSIVDANITTLMTAFVLYGVGTGSIKGFAIATIIGIATSMFTAIIGTRAIVNLLYGSKNIHRLSI